MNPLNPENGKKLPYMDFYLKICSNALVVAFFLCVRGRVGPIFHFGLNDEEEEIELEKFIFIIWRKFKYLMKTCQEQLSLRYDTR